MGKKVRLDEARAVRILLVDDDPVICSLGREILEHLGYRVEVAREGLEALRLYGENGGADLVILDFYLPGPNGLKVLKELKVMDPGARVLFASGFFGPQDLDRLRGEGASGLIRKPFRVAELQTQIRLALAEAPGF